VAPEAVAAAELTRVHGAAAGALDREGGSGYGRSQWGWTHFHAPLCIPCVSLHTEQTGGKTVEMASPPASSTPPFIQFLDSRRDSAPLFLKQNRHRTLAPGPSARRRASSGCSTFRRTWARARWGSVARTHCTFVHPLYTGLANSFGASLPVTAMRLNPRATLCRTRTRRTRAAATATRPTTASRRPRRTRAGRRSRRPRRLGSRRRGARGPSSVSSCVRWQFFVGGRSLAVVRWQLYVVAVVRWQLWPRRCEVARPATGPQRWRPAPRRR
jgi:hypothetical protein